MRCRFYGGRRINALKWHSVPSAQRGSASRDFIEVVVIAMLAFSIGLAIGAILCRCGH